MVKIMFWKKDSGNLMSHKQGLTEEQVEMLQALKPGDRLILMYNTKVNDASPAYSLMKSTGPVPKPAAEPVPEDVL